MPLRDLTTTSTVELEAMLFLFAYSVDLDAQRDTEAIRQELPPRRHHPAGSDRCGKNPR
jgi:hypothetical protein